MRHSMSFLAVMAALLSGCGGGSDSGTTAGGGGSGGGSSGGGDNPPAAGLPAFPDAGGFGRYATGGRGGEVVYVTNLNADGPGSLNWALGYTSDPKDMEKPRYILFKVSGIVSGGTAWNQKTHVEWGDFTLAGQTSPGGIITPGLFAFDRLNRDHLQNMIIRHIRSRPSGQTNGLDDAMRFETANNMIIDHCSLAWADDEAMQIAKNRDFTIQNSMFAETLGDHWDRGGILIKYHDAEHPNTRISFHHNLLNRIGGRMPQVAFNQVANADGVYINEQQQMDIEISNNVMWDPGVAVYFTNFATENQRYSDNWFHANLINNYYFVRPTYPNGMFSSSFKHTNDALYVSGNRMNLYPSYADYQLFYGNNDFATHNPAPGTIGGTKRSSRHDFPPIAYTDTDQLLDYMVANVGAFPRDPMDRRLIGFVARREIDPTHWKDKGADDGYLLDWSSMPLPPLDSDDDGMPDDWEVFNGLNPLLKDHTGKSLSPGYLGVTGYDNLEVYLEMLSRHLIDGRALTIGTAAVSPALIERVTVNTTNPKAGAELELALTLKTDKVKKVEFGLAQLLNPFASPAPAPVDVTAQRVGTAVSYRFTVPAARTAGQYQLLAHVEDENGRHQYQVIPLTLQ